MEVFPEGRIMRLLDITSGLRTDWRAITAGISILLVVVFALTYLITSRRASQLSKSPAPLGNRPPMAPYWIPFIGHAISYLIDGAGLVAGLEYVLSKSSLARLPPS